MDGHPLYTQPCLYKDVAYMDVAYTDVAYIYIYNVSSIYVNFGIYRLFRLIPLIAELPEFR